MPGDNRRRRGSPSGNPLDTFFDIFKQGAGQAVGSLVRQVGDAMLPTCCTCGERAYLAAPCIKCGRYSCHIDGYFNLTTQTSVCADCADEIDEGAAPRARAEYMEEGDPTIDDYPWCVLGIEPTWDAAEINRAFRKQAKRYHPDVVQGDPQAAEAFKVLQAAKNEALEMIRAGV